MKTSQEKKLLEDVLRQCLDEMRFAMIFISTKQKMHPEGFTQFHECIESAEKRLPESDKKDI